MHHLKNLNRTVLHLFLMHKIIALHRHEAVAFLGTSPELRLKRFPEILLLVLSSCKGAAWSPLTSYFNSPTQASSHPPRIRGRHSKQFFPSQSKRASLAADTGRGTAGLNTTSDSWLFSCVHCCHGHIFAVVLKGVGFTILILPTERKCHEFNLWSLTFATPAFVH